MSLIWPMRYIFSGKEIFLLFFNIFFLSLYVLIYIFAQNVKCMVPVRIVILGKLRVRIK